MSRRHQPAEMWGTCSCGKRGWVSRKAARKACRTIDRADHMAVYRCTASGMWHVGHLPPEVKDGRWSRDRLVQVARPTHRRLPGGAR